MSGYVCGVGVGKAGGETGGRVTPSTPVGSKNMRQSSRGWSDAPVRLGSALLGA